MFAHYSPPPLLLAHLQNPKLHWLPDVDLHQLGWSLFSLPPIHCTCFYNSASLRATYCLFMKQGSPQGRKARCCECASHLDTIAHLWRTAERIHIAFASFQDSWIRFCCCHYTYFKHSLADWTFGYSPAQLLEFSAFYYTNLVDKLKLSYHPY